MTPLRTHRWLVLILGLYAGLGLAYNAATPVGEGPDEPSHLEVVHYLRRHRALPVAPGATGTGPAQAKHPPLYYLLAAALTAGTDISRLGFIRNPHFAYNPDDPPVPNAHAHLDVERFPYTAEPAFLVARALRLLSLLCGLAVVGATYALGRAVWPTAPALSWGAAAVVAFTPGFLLMSSVFNNDAMANAWSALAMLAAVRIGLGHTRRRDFLLAGAVLGLGLLTKLTTMALAGVVALGVLARAWRDRGTRPPSGVAAQALAAGWWIALPIAIIWGWWVARNVRLYGPGDPLGLHRWHEAIPDLARKIPLAQELGAYASIQWRTFWGDFGWASVPLPAPWYAALVVMTGFAIAGWVKLLARDRAALAGETRWGLAIVAAGVALVYASVFRLAFSLDLTVAHGRLLYVALPGIALLWLAGLVHLVRPDRRPVLAACVAAGMFGLSCYAVAAVIRPAYRLPDPVPAAEVGAIPHRVDVDFDRRLRLVGHDSASPRLVAGAPLTITLYWQALPESWEPFPPAPVARFIFLHLVDASGEVAGRLDVAPFGGRHPAFAWTPGAVLRETYVVPTRANAVHGRAVLLIGMYEASGEEAGGFGGADGSVGSGQSDGTLGSVGSGQSDGTLGSSGVRDDSTRRLAATHTGRPLGDAYRLEPLVIEPTAPFALPARARAEHGAWFGPDRDIELVGHIVDATSGGWAVTLFWQRRTTFEGDGTVFVHLADSSGAVLATGDGQPQGGRYPTSLWRAGEIVPDEHVIPHPRDLPAGRYTVRVGWYGRDPEFRLPAYRSYGPPGRGGPEAAGERWPNDAVDIAVIDWPR